MKRAKKCLRLVQLLFESVAADRDSASPTHYLPN